MSGEQKSGGGSRKIGRNKKKCEIYRFTHGRAVGSKKPKYGKHRERPRPGYVDDRAYQPEDRVPKFIPRHREPHLCIELTEAHETSLYSRFNGTFGENAEELARHIRPHLRERVLFKPKRPEPAAPEHMQSLRPRPRKRKRVRK